MKAFGVWVLLLVIGTALVCLGFSSKGNASSGHSGTDLIHFGDGMRMTTKCRKLKDHGYAQSANKDHAGNINLEDYRPIDPVPSSKASIRPGPIQHGTPLMPYIPKLPPPPSPSSPKRIGSP